MLFSNRNTSFTGFAGVALVAALTSGCGSDSPLDQLLNSTDLGDLSADQIGSSVQQGMTRSMTSNLDSIGQVFSDSSAMGSLGALFTGDSSPAAKSARSSHDTDDTFGGFGDLLEVIGDLADHSTVTNVSGDVVTLDPNESAICSGAAAALDIQASSCVDIISQITLEVDVDTIVDDQVVDATAEVKFNQVTFLVVDFTLTSLYYEARLAGLKSFLTGVALAEGETADLPDTMTGAIRLAATVSGEEAGTITLSVPTAVQLASTSPATDINIAATNKLFQLSVDGTNESLSFEIGINPVDLLFTDEDSNGSFPVHLTMNGLSGQFQLNGNTETITVTGATLDSLTVKVDNVDAVTASLSELDFRVDGSGDLPIIAFTKALNLDLSLTNLRGMFEEQFGSTNANETLTAALDAPLGTTLTFLENDIIKVTGDDASTGGDASIVVDATDGDINVQIANGLCLDDSGDEPVVVSCPSAN